MSVGIEEFEVVVVGAGPGGLASGVTLGSYGVDTLVVERRLSSSTLPPATVASTGAMELLRRWGLEQRARGRAIDVEGQGGGPPHPPAPGGGGGGWGLAPPPRGGGALATPPPPACRGQDELEPLLEEH